MIIGLIQAYQEEGNIGAAVESLFAVGCDRVTVVDGAWSNPGGSYFGGGEFLSADRTADEATAAGADVIAPPEQPLTDGSKRDWSIRNCGAHQFDHVLILDGDERAHGRITDAPSGHGCVILRNDKPNDLPFRTPWLDSDIRASVPMLRWLRWSASLRCSAPGRYTERDPIEPYLVAALAARGDALDGLERAALAALRSVELELPNEHVSFAPIVPGIEISHCVPSSTDRVAAKHAYYQPEPVPA